ncbi:MAG: LysM peptidoglycan-binding domain-containing protein [Anaerolineae bacterium]|nr:LysM peptidoglycan-binding domain-containing protein [Anaerolineae bacterium]
MRRFAPVLFVVGLLAAACTLNQPEVIVITATFLPPTSTAAVVPPTPEPTLLPLPEGTLIDPTPNPERPQTETVSASDYVVQAGDTLYAIAAENGVSIETLLSVNDIPNPDALFVGQVIHLPAPPTVEGSAFKIVPDSRLVRAPGSPSFSVTSFVNQQPGYIRTATDTINDVPYTAAQIVQRVALEYSVDPRLLLALIEYRTHLLSSSAPRDADKDFAVGAPPYTNGIQRKGLYLQLAWAADQLNYGYYGWNLRELDSVEFSGGERRLFARRLNPGTVGVQYVLSIGASLASWERDVGMDGLYRTYIAYFGDPFADPVEPLIPNNLQQPELTFPFPRGQVWYFTGGPHGGYGSGSAWAAVDFAPPDNLETVTSACYVSENFATALAPGVIARTDEGTVVLDLDGDGDETTGWVILYLHIASRDRIAQGTVVQVGDRIGRPSCEGGFSNGTHMHIARRYNGEWIPVSCDGCVPGVQRPPLVMDGWTVYGLAGQEYQGGMVKGGESRVAEQGRDIADNEVGW